MKLSRLFTAGLIAASIAGFANPTQVIGQEPISPVQETKTSKTPAPETDYLALASEFESGKGRTLTIGSEVSLDPVMKAEWIQGEAPKSF